MDTVSDVRETYDRAAFSTETQAKLARLWAKVLEVDWVGPGDNFILRGGDSLRAAALFAEVDAVFGVTLPLDVIFDEGETVSEMAALIDSLVMSLSDRLKREEELLEARSEIVGITAKREKTGAIPLAEWSDLTTVLTLFGLATICWFPGRNMRSALCRQIARAHIALRGSRANNLRNAIPLLDTYSTAEGLERDILAGGYEDMISILCAYLPKLNFSKDRLIGRPHIEKALMAGNGAVLWKMPGAPGGQVGSRALARVGARIAQLRSYAHPYSASRLGIKFLNPIANRVSDRHLMASAILHEDNAIEIMAQLGAYLGRNMVVQMSANGSSGAPHEMPFFGGTLCLALGPPTLALLHNAPLIPTFCIPNEAGGFDYIAEAPLTDDTDRSMGERARALAIQYSKVLERYVKRHPQLWRCWFMRNTWRA